MGIPSGLPVVDHHCHLSPHAEGVRAVERFRAAGGTHLFLATQNYRPGPLVHLDEYRQQFETTIELARTVGERTGVVVYVVLAPYPVDLVSATPPLGLAAAVELHREALELAAKYVREQQAVALGEVGRPHFPVAPEIAEAAAGLLRHALALGRDVDCPVVVHSEDLDRDGFLALGEEGRAAGLAPGRLVKHYARSRVESASTTGVVPSYLARRELARAVFDDPEPWFWETDFLDDPSRPGAVLDLTTVPRRAAQLATARPSDVDRLWGPFVRSVEKVYRLTPKLSSGGVR